MKVRCHGCDRYVRKTDMYRKIGLGWVCSPECAANSRRPRKERPGKERPVRARPVSVVPVPTRLAVLSRDGVCCRFCGRPGPGLHLHHVHHRSEGVDHSANNLVALCAEHHAVVHTDKRRWQPVLLAYIWLRTVEGRSLTIPQVERHLARL